MLFPTQFNVCGIFRKLSSRGSMYPQILQWIRFKSSGWGELKVPNLIAYGRWVTDVVEIASACWATSGREIVKVWMSEFESQKVRVLEGEGVWWCDALDTKISLRFIYVSYAVKHAAQAVCNMWNSKKHSKHLSIFIHNFMKWHGSKNQSGCFFLNPSLS